MGLNEKGTVTIEVKGKDSTGGAFKSAHSSMTSLAKGAAVAGGAAVAAGAAVMAGIAVKGATEFIGFQDQMNEVFTLMPEMSQQAMDQMSQDVLDASVDMGRLPDELIPALYQSLSAGVPSENVFSFLEQAHKTGLAGVTDIETAVDALTSVTNAYGSDVISAGEASDLLFSAVKGGKTTMGELADTISRVTPTTASLGVEFSTVTAAMAAITSQGIKTKQAGTKLASMFTDLSKKGSKVDKAFREVAGQGFADFIAAGGTTQEALGMLSQHAEDSSLSLKDLFGSVEAGDAALILAGSGAEKFAQELDNMSNSAGATEGAYDTMNSGIARTVEVLQAQLMTTLISVGDALAPLVSMIGEKLVAGFQTIEPFVSAFTEQLGLLITNLQGGMEPFEAIRTAIWNFMMAIGMTTEAAIPLLYQFDAIWAVINKVKLAVELFFNQLGDGFTIFEALANSLYVLGAAFGVSYQQLNAMELIYWQVVAAIQSVITTVMSVISPIYEWFAANIQLSDILIAMGILIASVLLPIIVSFIATILSILAPIALVVAAVVLLREGWENNWGGIQEKTQWVIDTIGPIFETIVEWLSVNIPVAIEFLVAVYHEILVPMWEDFKNFILNILIPAVEKLVEWLKVNIPAGIEIVVTKFKAFHGALQDLRTKISSFVSWAKAKWKSFVDKIKMPAIFEQSSPSPFEQSIMDINEEMTKLLGYTGPKLRVQLNALPSPAQRNAAGSTTQGVNNTRYRNNVYNLNVATQENAYRVINEFNIAAAYGGR